MAARALPNDAPFLLESEQEPLDSLTRRRRRLATLRRELLADGCCDGDPARETDCDLLRSIARSVTYLDAQLMQRRRPHSSRFNAVATSPAMAS